MDFVHVTRALSADWLWRVAGILVIALAAAAAASILGILPTWTTFFLMLRVAILVLPFCALAAAAWYWMRFPEENEAQRRAFRAFFAGNVCVIAVAVLVSILLP